MLSNGTAVSAQCAAHWAKETVSHEPKRMPFETVKIKKGIPQGIEESPIVSIIHLCIIYLSIFLSIYLSDGMSVSAPRAAHLATETMSHEPKKMSSEIVKNKKVSYNAIDKQSLYTYISINTYLSLIQKTFSQTACPLVPHARLIEQQKRCRTNLKNSRPKLSKSKQYVYMYIYIYKN
jgi:hypothetical protein